MDKSITQTEAVAALLAFLDSRVTTLVDQLLRERGQDAGDPLIRSDRLGPNNRIVLGLIKRGELGAVVIGNRWHVRRSEWARYVAMLEAKQAAERAAAAEDTAGNDDVDAAADRVLADLGLERRANARHGRRRGINGRVSR